MYSWFLVALRLHEMTKHPPKQRYNTRCLLRFLTCWGELLKHSDTEYILNPESPECKELFIGYNYEIITRSPSRYWLLFSSVLLPRMSLKAWKFVC
jgi:hypothetical protein